MTIKCRIRLFIRFIRDLCNKNYFRFPEKKELLPHFPSVYSHTQEIKKGNSFENKLYNIDKASKKISQYIIMPGEIFSFWKIIGTPEKDYRKSRGIKKGKLMEEKGGGLCQVSGMVYYISICNGLEVLERYNHSVDIYTDETRFTPLGTDATVVYGYKDLRIRNNYSFPISFQLSVKENLLTGHLFATEKTTCKKLSIKTEKKNDKVVAQVYDDMNILVNKSVYQLLN